MFPFPHTDADPGTDAQLETFLKAMPNLCSLNIDLEQMVTIVDLASLSPNLRRVNFSVLNWVPRLILPSQLTTLEFDMVSYRDIVGLLVQVPLLEHLVVGFTPPYDDVRAEEAFQACACLIHLSSLCLQLSNDPEEVIEADQFLNNFTAPILSTLVLKFRVRRQGRDFHPSLPLHPVSTRSKFHQDTRNGKHVPLSYRLHAFPSRNALIEHTGILLHRFQESQTGRH